MSSNKLLKAKVVVVAIMLIAMIVTLVAYGADNNEIEQLNNSQIEIVEEKPEAKGPVVNEPIIIITEEPKPIITKITRCDVNSRLNPLERDTPCDAVKAGTEVEVLSAEGGWSKVRYEGKEGYIASAYLITAEEWKEMNEFPYCEEFLMSRENQRIVWEECKKYGIKYAFALATIELESGSHDENGNLVKLNPDAFNGHDRGYCQVNKCWIKTFKKMGWINSADDLFNPEINIKCGMWILSDAVDEFGNCEQAYAFYNTGNPSIHSNKNSRVVMKYWEKWKGILGDI